MESLCYVLVDDDVNRKSLTKRSILVVTGIWYFGAINVLWGVTTAKSRKSTNERSVRITTIFPTLMNDE